MINIIVRLNEATPIFYKKIADTKDQQKQLIAFTVLQNNACSSNGEYMHHGRSILDKD